MTRAFAVLLGVATLAATGLLLMEAIDHATLRAWASVPLPAALAIGVAGSAVRARGRGEEKSTLALLVWGTVANAVAAALAA